jgi:hypothetical protein
MVSSPARISPPSPEVAAPIRPTARRSRASISAGPAAPPAAAHLFAHLLELLPLLGREHLAQALVRTAAYLLDARLGLFAQGVELRARVVENLPHLRLLLRAQLQALAHLLEAVLLGRLRMSVAPGAVGVQGERARGEAEQEDDRGRGPNLPTAFRNPVHRHFSAPSSAPYRVAST